MGRCSVPELVFRYGKVQHSSKGLSNLNKGGNLNLKYNDIVVAGFQTDPGDKIKTKGIQIMFGYQLPLDLN